MPKIICVCEHCGKTFERWPHEAKGRTWCSQSCHMKTLNAEMNPTRNSLRKRADKDTQRVKREKTLSSDSYKKFNGRHEHRIVAEQILGRSLRSGEVVHHINGDKHDNRPENLRVFASQAEHAAEHFKTNNVRKRSVLRIETGVTYPTMHIAALETGCNEKAISSVCRGVKKTTGGLHWRYASDEEVMS